jgi:acetolactate synthase I/II/III large subunit
MKFILVRHEQGAVHMADGYARATGKPAVVLVTSGPGCRQHGHRPDDRA